MWFVCVLIVLGLPAVQPATSAYEDVSWYVKSMLSGQVGILGQSVRVPRSLFTQSACQLVYMATPDWATSHAYVDFGSSSTTTGCTQQAFLVYVDGYNAPPGITGIGSKAEVPWASLLTDPEGMETELSGGSDTGSRGGIPSPIPRPGSAPSPDGAGSSASSPSPQPSSSGSSNTDASRRRELGSAIDLPLDREGFATRYDNLRDRVEELVRILKSDEDLIPEVDGPLSTPILASGYFQREGAVPRNPRPFLDYLERKNLLEASGVQTDTSDDPPAGIVSGKLRIYSPLPKECLHVMRQQRKRVLGVAGMGSSSGGGSGFKLVSSVAAGAETTAGTSSFTWNPMFGYSQDTCFVVQQAVLIYNDCPGNAVPASSGSNSRSSRSSSSNSSIGGMGSANVSTPWFNCSGEMDLQSEVACLLERPLLQGAINMSYVPDNRDVRILLLYQPYVRCYRQFTQALGQSGVQLIFFSGGIILLLTIILLTPTLFRLFISFPCRCIAYGFRKLVRRGRVSNLPFNSGLHSYKLATHHRCYDWPVLGHLLRARKHLLYAMCTIHSADGQYRALQVAVTSSVALMICMMSFPPRIIPPIEYYIPPLNFKIERTSDALSSVWYFLTILAYSLYLGFIGYLAMLCNYNRPCNRYYLTQAVISVFFMLVLDALVLMQAVGILVYWDRLNPRWPWLPMIVFQLANLLVANVLMVVILFSREDRRVARRQSEYVALMEELKLREAHLAHVRAAQRKAAALKKSSEAATATASTASTRGADSEESAQQPSDSLPSPPPPPAANGGSLRRRATLGSRAGESTAVVCPSPSESQRRGQPPPRPDGEFDSLATIGREDMGREGESTATAAAVAEGEEGRRSQGAGHCSGGWVSVPAAQKTGGAPGLAAGADASASSGGGNDEGSEASSGQAVGSAAVLGALPPAASARGGSGRSAVIVANLQSLRRRWREKQAPSWLRVMWRLVARPLHEDAAFRYPAWLLAALVVSGYMLIFTYARAMNWSKNVEVCISDPADCLNNNLARYMVFTTRLVGRDWQVKVRDSLDAMAASQTSLQAILNGAVTGENTLPGFSSTIETMTANLTNSVADMASNQISAALSTDVTALVNETMGPEWAARIPPGQASAFQARMQSLVATRLGQVNVSSVSQTLALGVEYSLVRTFNVTMNQFFTVVNTASKVLSVTINVSDQLEKWTHNLQRRFFGCSVAGFTLGLLLGLSSLVRTAISFRVAARKLRLASIADRVFATQYDTDERGGRWAMKSFRSIYDEDDSIVRRSAATSITLVVFFFGVLLSTAIVQLYAVGVTLSVVLALATHPWTWTWLLPNYYMWLVAIIIGLFLNKVILIAYIGDTWLSNGDQIYRPAAWLAFVVVASATNLVIGLLLALYRIVLLLVTTIFTLGKLDVTIFTILAKLDLPHQTFLAGLHLQESMSRFNDPIYLPGPRGRAHRRWRKLRAFLAEHRSSKLREFTTGGKELGAPAAGQQPTGKAVQQADQVLVVVPDPSAMTLSYGQDKPSGPGAARPTPPPPLPLPPSRNSSTA